MDGPEDRLTLQNLPCGTLRTLLIGHEGDGVDTLERRDERGLVGDAAFENLHALFEEPRGGQGVGIAREGTNGKAALLEQCSNGRAALLARPPMTRTVGVLIVVIGSVG